MLQHRSRPYWLFNLNKHYKVMKKVSENVFPPSGKIKKLWLTMKFSFLILFCLAMQSFIELEAQKLTVKMENASLEEILWNLRKQTKFVFLYSNQDVEPFKGLNVSVENENMEVVMKEVLKNTNLEYSVTNDAIVIRKKMPDNRVKFAAAQQKMRTIQGTVMDKRKELLPGVTIMVKGTTYGGTTDINGKFSFQVPDKPETELSVSYVGMVPQKIVLGDRTELHIVMEEMVETMEEVMVVAYGTVKKESFTGSAAVVKGDQIMRESAPVSAEKALQGYVAGVRITQTDGQPGAKATVQIRGIGSINGNIEPLYVIDGVPVISGDMSQVMSSSNVMTALNPNDIESMTVLKDAAATSLYGSRAANGVIIITTKQGRAGKTVFNADYEHGWTTTAMPHELFGLYMTGKEYTEYALEGLKNRYLYDRNALPGQAAYDAGNAGIVEDAMAYAYSNLNSRAKVIHPDDPLDGSFDYKQADPKKYLSHARNTDWAKALFSTGKEDRFNFSARGGNDKLKFFSSFGYMKQVGLLPTSKFQRVTGKINVESRVNKQIKYAINQTLAQTDQSGTASGGYYSNPIWGVKNTNPTAPVYMPNGEYYRYPGFVTKIPNYKKNVREQVRESSNFRSMTTVSLTIDFTDWLTFRTVNGIDYLHLTESSFSGIDSHDGRNEKGNLGEYLTKVYDLTTSNTLNFTKSFGQHNLTVLGGYEAKKYKNKYFGAYGTGFISDKFLQLDNAANAAEVGGAYSDDRLVSWLLKADYNYKNKYYLSGSVRRDGSSRLALKERWGNFFAASAAWTMSQEKFMKPVTWIDNLRLKVSFGTTGNLPSTYFGSQSLFSLENKYNGNPVFFLKTVGNPKLTWEHSYTWNAGIDFRLFGSRLSGGIEYYNKMTDNLLNNASVSVNTGFSSILVNEGRLRNSGVELTLSSQNVVGEGFNWSTDFNISWMTAKVESLKDDVISSQRIFREGEKLYSFYMREWAGVDGQTGRPLWYKNVYGPDGKTPVKDGSTTSKVAESNRVVLCKAYPDFYGGMTNRFSYQGIELSFLLTFTLGGNMFHNLDRLSADGRYIGTYNPSKNAAEGVWRKPGDKASKPLIIYNNPYQSQEYSSRYIHSTDHLRVKNISLSYNLPKRWMERWGIANTKVYFNATDVLTFYKYNYINPEVSYTGNTNSGSSYPAIKSYRFGIQVQF